MFYSVFKAATKRGLIIIVAEISAGKFLFSFYCEKQRFLENTKQHV